MLSIVLALLAALPAVAEDTSNVALTTDKPVYKAEAGGDILIRFKNVGPAEVGLKHAKSWRITNAVGTKLISAGSAILIPLPLSSGQEKSWTWDKKDSSGKFVKPGSYLVQVDFWTPEGSPSTRSCWIALTPTGKLAGTSRFPLSVGNEWVFSPSNNTGLITTRVISKLGSWFKIESLLVMTRWVHMSSGPPVLSTAFWTTDPLQVLFRFSLPQGSTYSVKVAGMWKMKVGSVKDTVVTPAGTFENCYRLDVIYLPPKPSSWGYHSFHFAPGVGMVQFKTFTVTSAVAPVSYKLLRARIKGTNGKVYRMGQK